MIHYKIFFVFLFFTIISTSGCAISSKNSDSTVNTSNLETYTDNTLGYTLKYPTDWDVSDEVYEFTKQELADKTLSQRMFYLPYPEAAAWPEVQVGVAMYTVSTNHSLEDIMRNDEDIVNNEPENISNLKVGDYEALRYEFNNPIEGGPQIELLVRKGEKIYDIEATAGDDEKFVQWKPTLEQIISSFQVSGT